MVLVDLRGDLIDPYLVLPDGLVRDNLIYLSLLDHPDLALYGSLVDVNLDQVSHLFILILIMSI